MNLEKCPRCGKRKMHPDEASNALSRKDNETFICNDCGADEAIEEYRKWKEVRIYAKVALRNGNTYRMSFVPEMLGELLSQLEKGTDDEWDLNGLQVNTSEIRMVKVESQ